MKYFLVFLLACHAPASFAESEKYTILWEIAHDPNVPEYNAQLEDMAKAIHQRSDGRLSVKLKTSEFPGPQGLYEATNRVYRNEVQMSQVRTGDLVYYDSSIGVMNVPFLFESHEHAAKVIDGPIGKKLLAGLLTSSRDKIRGLNFTYSGGYRQIYGNKKVQSPEDLKGFRMLQPGLKVSLEYFDGMGATFIGSEAFTPDRGINEALAAKRMDGAELEYARSAKFDTGNIKYVNETNHSLYLTVIIANEQFYGKLPSDLKKILSEEVKKLADREREFSVKNEVTWKKKLIAEGVSIVTLNQAQTNRFITAAKPLYKFYSKTDFGPYIRSIEALRSNSSKLGLDSEEMPVKEKRVSLQTN